MSSARETSVPVAKHAKGSEPVGSSSKHPEQPQQVVDLTPRPARDVPRAAAPPVHPPVPPLPKVLAPATVDVEMHNESSDEDSSPNSYSLVTNDIRWDKSPDQKNKKDADEFLSVGFSIAASLTTIRRWFALNASQLKTYAGRHPNDYDTGTKTMSSALDALNGMFASIMGTPDHVQCALLTLHDEYREIAADNLALKAGLGVANFFTVTKTMPAPKPTPRMTAVHAGKRPAMTQPESSGAPPPKAARGRFQASPRRSTLPGPSGRGPSKSPMPSGSGIKISQSPTSSASADALRAIREMEEASGRNTSMDDLLRVHAQIYRPSRTSPQKAGSPSLVTPPQKATTRVSFASMVASAPKPRAACAAQAVRAPSTWRGLTLTSSSKLTVVSFMETIPYVSHPSSIVMCVRMSAALQGVDSVLFCNAAAFTTGGSVHLTTNRTLDDSGRKAVAEEISRMLGIPNDGMAFDVQPFSHRVCITFHGVPCLTELGSPIAAAEVAKVLSQCPVWALNAEFICDRRWGPSTGSDTNQLIIEVVDDVHGDRACALNNTFVQFANGAAQGEILVSHKTVSLCDRCWTWGHPRAICHHHNNLCMHCGGAHSLSHHAALAECCAATRGTPCAHPPVCINCRRNHMANSRECEFFTKRHDADWHKRVSSQRRVTFDEVVREW